MNTKNLNAIVNSWIDGEINTRRGNKWRSYFKRQSRRQARHRLASELNASMYDHLADTFDPLNVETGGVPGTGYLQPGAIASGKLITRKAALQSVVVIRKVKLSSFECKQSSVDLLAA